MQTGLKRGGLKVADEARLHVGIARWRAGQMAAVLEALRSIQARGQVANLALIWELVAAQ